MWDFFKSWYQRKFSDPAAITLFLLLLVGFILVVFFGGLLAPIIVAIALAYLLEWPVVKLMRVGFSRLTAVLVVFTLFVGLAVVLVVFMVPVVWQQGIALTREVPDMLAMLQQWVHALPARLPDFVDEAQVVAFTAEIKGRVLGWVQQLLTFSLMSLVNVMALMVYLIIVPLLLFFMLKDRDVLMHHASRLLPKERRLISQVGREMNLQIMNYIRGKALELVIVGIVSFVVFVAFDLRYALLLAVLVGLSVLIPYVGAALVTVPVVLVALFQFGISMEFAWLVIAYLIVQALDGNLLVPILFSEAVNLNPVYIIGSVLIFGGIWGFWGAFFAIPLASLVKAVISAWSSPQPALDSLPEAR
ncbi:AI-2E family transporter [Idiomarina xiamenensis]|uniref:Permease PerM n=1 Tax=Idiomarina xiamenensis 10-D-4 TaxID=740709 RepID=K2KJG0_9GAMM|nr:AI-2E family transporter [Idiomarina xiamenensis]EKE86862.1 permease PerM [Idiomarina xiamenensis 10-D-4]